MPGQYWAYGFYALLSTPLLIVIFAMSWGQVRSLAALAALPTPAGDPDGTRGAIYRGALEGPTETTPDGQEAVAWIGTVTRAFTRGRGRYTTERCRLGTLADLQLIGAAGQRWTIHAPVVRDVDLELGFNGLRSTRVRYRFGAARTRSPVPEEVIRRCHIDRAALVEKATAWAYEERWAVRGAQVEVASCRHGSELAGCASGEAIGHLSATGIHGMTLHLADATMGLMALLGYLMMFFTIVGGIGATLALRRAAGAGPARAAQGKTS